MPVSEKPVLDSEKEAIFRTKEARRPIVLYRRGDKQFSKFRLEAQNRVISITQRHAREERLSDQDKAWLQTWVTDSRDEFSRLVIAFLSELKKVTGRPINYE